MDPLASRLRLDPRDVGPQLRARITKDIKSVRPDLCRITDAAYERRSVEVTSNIHPGCCGGSSQIMAAQMAHLVAVARLPNATIQVVPATEHAGLLGGFSLTERAAYVETAVAGQERAVTAAGTLQAMRPPTTASRLSDAVLDFTDFVRICGETIPRPGNLVLRIVSGRP